VLMPLLLGSAILVGNMAIQILAVVMMFRILLRHKNMLSPGNSLFADTRVISIVVLVLFAGHILQFATWAFVYMRLGEFTDFDTAFYFSTVSFTSLGYGDIVLTGRWRLLGGLEAANGVLMFGLSAGTILSVMNQIFKRHVDTRKLKQSGQE
jgi:magnesium-transporting ATPase (P-type)